MTASKLPLEGIRILEFGNLLAVPHAVKLLTDMGAETIKIESTVRLNAHRNSIFVDNDPQERFWNRAANFNDQNRGKLEITLDLTQAEGREVAYELVKTTDVVCENFAPRVMGTFGLDYESLKKIKPDIIMLSSTANGHTGPWGSYSGGGGTTGAAGGIVWLSGYPDKGLKNPNIPYSDFVGAHHGAFAAMAALHYRRLTGKGQWIDLAQAETCSSQIGEEQLDYITNGHHNERMGNRRPFMAPHGCYPCSGDDQWIAIQVSTEEEWVALCQAMGNPAWCRDDRFATPMLRYENQDTLEEYLVAWTSQTDHYELMHLLQEHGVPAGAVLSNKELLLDPHYKARDFYQVLEHLEPGVGKRVHPGVTWKMSKTPGRIRRAAPVLGQDNEYILTQILQKSQSEVEALERAGVIGKEPVQAAPSPVTDLETMKRQGSILDYDPDYKAVLGI